MRIGQLRERIALQRQTRVDNNTGGTVNTWSTFADVWSEWTLTGGGATDEAQQTLSRRVFDVKIRLRNDVDDTLRLLRKGKFYAVFRVNDSTDPTFLMLSAEELPDA